MPCWPARQCHRGPIPAIRLSRNAFSRSHKPHRRGEILEISCMRRVDLSQKLNTCKSPSGKTACLLGESCRLGALAANASPGEVRAAYDFGLNLGLAFQIVDDALDFAPGEQTSKALSGRRRQGSCKLTPPAPLSPKPWPCRKGSFDRAFANGTIIDEQMAGEIAKSIREKGL